jgi:hypothetical protein
MPLYLFAIVGPFEDGTQSGANIVSHPVHLGVPFLKTTTQAMITPEIGQTRLSDTGSQVSSKGFNGL